MNRDERGRDRGRGGREEGFPSHSSQWNGNYGPVNGGDLSWRERPSDRGFHRSNGQSRGHSLPPHPPPAHLRDGERGRMDPMQGQDGFQMDQRSWQSRDNSLPPHPPPVHLRDGRRGRMNPMQGMNQHNWQSHYNSLPPARDMTFPMQGQGGDRNVGKKRYFGDNLENLPQQFNPHPRQKNARLHSPPHRPQLDDSLLRDLRHLLFEQSGSLRIQQVLHEGGSTAATAILNEGIPFWADTMAHPYGNYLFQKIVECITPSERVTLVKSVSTRLVDASRSKYGIQSVQKIVEVCAIENMNVSREEAACNHTVFNMLTDAFKPAVVHHCVDTYTTFVIQCILLKLPYQYTQFIFEAVAASIEDVARHRNGCIVINRCLDSRHSEARTPIVKSIADKAFILMQDAVMSCLVQEALKVCRDDEVRAICESVIGKVCHLATQKFSSRPIQMCLERCPGSVREQYLCELIESGRIREVMMHPFGNYFAQKALSVATNEQATRLVESMRPYLSSQNDTDAGVRNILRQIYKRFPSFNLDDGASRIESSTALVESSPASTSGAVAISGNANVSSALAAQPPSVPDGEASSVRQQNVASSDPAGSSSSASASASAAQPQSGPNNFANLDSALEAMRSRKLEQRSSNQSQPAIIAPANAARDAPDRTRPTATPRSSSSKILDVVFPSKDFWVRNLFSEKETSSRVRARLDKTNALLRREMGLSRTSRYPLAIEQNLREIYDLITKFVLEWRRYIAAKCTNKNGQFVLQKLVDESGGVYGISSSGNVEKTKIGSGCGIEGIPGRSGEQVPPGTDLDKYVGVFFTLNKIMGVLKSNEVLGQLADRIYKLLPWVGSYIPYRFEFVANHLVETACASIFKGDGGVLCEWLLYGGNPSVHDTVIRPPPIINATAESDLIVEEIRVGMTWPREITQIFDQITQRSTFDGRQLSITDRQMVKAMLYLNEVFMQQFFIYNRLLGTARVKVHGHVNAVSRSPIDAAMAVLTGSAREILTPESVEDVDVPALKQMLKEGLGKFWRPGQSFYWLEMELCGNREDLAKATEQKLVKLVDDSIASGKKTLVIAERAHEQALKQHLRTVHKRFFGEDKLVTCIKCADRTTVAGHLYRTSDRNVRILLTGSYFGINVHEGVSFKTQMNLSSEFVAIMSLLARVGVVDDSAVNKEVRHLQSYLHQKSHPVSNHMAAIVNNTLKGYHFGLPGKEGLQAMINFLKEALCLEGIYHETMAAFALHLGAEYFEKLFAVLGRKIDCSNMTKTMLMFKRKQGDLGVMPTSRRESIRQARTGSTHTEETKQKMRHTKETKQKMTQTRTQLTDQDRADRRSQYDVYKRSNELVGGEMSSVAWDRKSTTWNVRLREKHFGKPTRVGYFKQLSDATAAMKHLDEALKDKSKREDETFVNKVIKHVRSKFNACYLGGKWQVSEIENIL